MIYQKITAKLVKIPGVDAVWLVGLRRKNEKRSFDLLASCDGGIENYSNTIMNKLGEEWPMEDFFLCDDSVRISISGIKGGIAVYDTAKLKMKIQHLINGYNLNGECRPWATAYWIPEALCGDLSTARPLYDPKGIYETLHQLLVPYPLDLSLAICRFCKDEIDQKIQALSLLGKKQEIEIGLTVSDICASLVRYAFSRSKVYLRGFRNLDSQSKKLTNADKTLVQLVEQLSLIKILDDKEELVALTACIKEALL